MKFDQMICPKCGAIATADFVDNGVGMQRSGPYGCETCGWVETPLHDLLEVPDDEVQF